MTNTKMITPAPKQTENIKPKDIEKAATFLEKIAKALRSLLSIFR